MPTSMQLLDLRAHHRGAVDALRTRLEEACRRLGAALQAEGLVQTPTGAQARDDEPREGLLRTVCGIPFEEAFLGATGEVTLELASSLDGLGESLSWCGIRVYLAGRQLETPLPGATLATTIVRGPQDGLADLAQALEHIEAETLAARVHRMLVP